MKIAGRLEVKYSYLFLTSLEQDSFAVLTSQYSPRGNYNDIVDWLPSAGTFKRDNEASMPPFWLHCPGLCMSALPRAKGIQVQEQLCPVERRKLSGHCQTAGLSCPGSLCCTYRLRCPPEPQVGGWMRPSYWVFSHSPAVGSLTRQLPG